MGGGLASVQFRPCEAAFPLAPGRFFPGGLTRVFALFALGSHGFEHPLGPFVPLPRPGSRRRRRFDFDHLGVLGLRFVAEMNLPVFVDPFVNIAGRNVLCLQGYEEAQSNRHEGSRCKFSVHDFACPLAEGGSAVQCSPLEPVTGQIGTPGVEKYRIIVWD